MSGITGKRIVFIGTVGSKSRAETARDARALGAIVQRELTARTDFLVTRAGAKAQRKASAATQAKTLTSKQWLTICSRSSPSGSRPTKKVDAPKSTATKTRGGGKSAPATDSTPSDRSVVSRRKEKKAKNPIQGAARFDCWKSFLVKQIYSKGSDTVVFTSLWRYAEICFNAGEVPTPNQEGNYIDIYPSDLSYRDLKVSYHDVNIKNPKLKKRIEGAIENLSDEEYSDFFTKQGFDEDAVYSITVSPPGGTVEITLT